MSKKNLIQLTSVQNFFQSLFFLFILLFSSPPTHAQSTGITEGPGSGGEGEPVFCIIQDPILNYNCSGLTVKLSTLSFITPKQWGFGDGVVIASEEDLVEHVYVDINPYLNPITATLTTVDDEVCTKEVLINGVHIGSGCGSVRKVSELLAKGVLPPSLLQDVPLYIYGSLEVDVAYEFKNCDIFVRGGDITVENGSALTLSDNTVLDANIGSGGSCSNLWNGIKVKYGGNLTTNFCTIKNTYTGIKGEKPLS